MSLLALASLLDPCCADRPLTFQNAAPFRSDQSYVGDKDCWEDGHWRHLSDAHAESEQPNRGDQRGAVSGKMKKSEDERGLKQDSGRWLHGGGGWDDNNYGYHGPWGYNDDVWYGKSGKSSNSWHGKSSHGKTGKAGKCSKSGGPKVRRSQTFLFTCSHCASHA